MPQDVRTGINVGLAQVISTMDYAKEFAQNAYRLEVQFQKNAALLAEAMKDYDPQKAGIRVPDMAEYNQAYNEFKNIYTANRKLYTNPASDIPAFKRAQELQSKMRTMAKESEYLDKQFFPKVAQTYMSSGGVQFDDDKIPQIAVWQNTPTSKIKEQNNGQLPTLLDFSFAVKNEDMMKHAMDINKFIIANNPQQEKFIKEPAPGDPYSYVEKKMVIPTYEEVSSAIDLTLKGSKNLQNIYLRDFDNMKSQNPNKIEDLTQFMRKRLQNQNYTIPDFREYARASNYQTRADGIMSGESKIVADWKKRTDYTAQLAMLRVIKAGKLADARAEKKAALKDSEKTQLLTNVDNLVNLHAAGKLETPDAMNLYGSSMSDAFGTTILLKGATIDEIRKKITEKKGYNEQAFNSSWKIPENEETYKNIQKYGLLQLDYNLGVTDPKYVYNLLPPINAKQQNINKQLLLNAYYTVKAKQAQQSAALDPGGQ